MAAAAEVQIGTARIYGIQGAYTATAIVAGAGSLNISSLGFADSFNVDEIGSSNGAVVETLIASRRRRDLTIELIPSGTTRSAADAVAETIAALTPFTVITLAAFDLSVLNSTWNYMSGGEVTMKRDTYVISNIKLANFATAADGAVFSALAIAT